MKLPSFFPLNANHGPVGRLYDGVSIQRYPDGKFPWLVITKDLNTSN
jgi:hypothetical protein